MLKIRAVRERDSSVLFGFEIQRPPSLREGTPPDSGGIAGLK